MTLHEISNEVVHLFAQQGDKVEYRPIGGAEENVAHSTGTIESVGQAEDGVSSSEQGLVFTI